MFLGFNNIYSDFIALLTNSFKKTGNSNNSETVYIRKPVKYNINMIDWLYWLITFFLLIIELGIGFFLFFFTPDRNETVGVRTKVALSSDERWDFINKYFGLSMLISFLIELPVTIISYFIFDDRLLSCVVLSLSFAMIIIILLVIFNEIGKKRFK